MLVVDVVFPRPRRSDLWRAPTIHWAWTHPCAWTRARFGRSGPVTSGAAIDPDSMGRSGSASCRCSRGSSRGEGRRRGHRGSSLLAPARLGSAAPWGSPDTDLWMRWRWPSSCAAARSRRASWWRRRSPASSASIRSSTRWWSGCSTGHAPRPSGASPTLRFGACRSRPRIARAHRRRPDRRREPLLPWARLSAGQHPRLPLPPGGRGLRRHQQRSGAGAPPVHRA